VPIQIRPLTASTVGNPREEPINEDVFEEVVGYSRVTILLRLLHRNASRTSIEGFDVDCCAFSVKLWILLTDELRDDIAEKWDGVGDNKVPF
jgi:hypothetical protein